MPLSTGTTRRACRPPPLITIGVWENSKFIGVVIFSRGANKNLGSAYSLKCTEVCELSRIALNKHTAPVSRIIKIALKLLRKRSPKLRLIVSFADSNQGHDGAIYRASNWLFAGRTPSSFKYRTKAGKELHQRQVSKSGVKIQYGQNRRVPKISECEKIAQLPKYRYILPLDDQMFRAVKAKTKQFTRADSIKAMQRPNQGEEGGAVPTSALSASNIESEPME